LEKVFLKYIFDWDKEVAAMTNLKAAQKAEFFISKPTFNGLIMTGTGLQQNHLSIVFKQFKIYQWFFNSLFIIK
jgi:hypothetical protein